jgi:hypothetical protein
VSSLKEIWGRRLEKSAATSSVEVPTVGDGEGDGAAHPLYAAALADLEAAALAKVITQPRHTPTFCR